MLRAGDGALVLAEGPVADYKTNSAAMDLLYERFAKGHGHRENRPIIDTIFGLKKGSIHCFHQRRQFTWQELAGYRCAVGVMHGKTAGVACFRHVPARHRVPDSAFTELLFLTVRDDSEKLGIATAVVSYVMRLAALAESLYLLVVSNGHPFWERAELGTHEHLASPGTQRYPVLVPWGEHIKQMRYPIGKLEPAGSGYTPEPPHGDDCSYAARARKAAFMARRAAGVRRVLSLVFSGWRTVVLASRARSAEDQAKAGEPAAAARAVASAKGAVRGEARSGNGAAAPPKPKAAKGKAAEDGLGAAAPHEAPPTPSPPVTPRGARRRRAAREEVEAVGAAAKPHTPRKQAGARRLAASRVGEVDKVGELGAASGPKRRSLAPKLDAAAARRAVTEVGAARGQEKDLDTCQTNWVECSSCKKWRIVPEQDVPRDEDEPWSVGEVGEVGEVVPGNDAVWPVVGPCGSPLDLPWISEKSPKNLPWISLGSPVISAGPSAGTCARPLGKVDCGRVALLAGIAA